MQLVAPEYAGAHVSAPTSHTTHRTLSLDFRAATALFGAFGIEWDLTEASDARPRVRWPRGSRGSSRCGRCCTAAAWSAPSRAIPRCCCTVWSAPRRLAQALVAHVQLDESAHNRGVHGAGARPVARRASYALTWEGPVASSEASMSVRPFETGPTAGRAGQRCRPRVAWLLDAEDAARDGDAGARGRWLRRAVKAVTKDRSASATSRGGLVTGASAPSSTSGEAQ